uniref:LysM domain-containing protein n=1 Tax=candidate division WOR-3 bacterium TaxID=2052148 RepID=A0A7C6A8Q0_UNCW3
MIIKLGDFQFPKPPEDFSITSPQKTAHIELPEIEDVIQDFGPGPKQFSLVGIFSKKMGGIGLALSLDEIKNKGERILFSIDRLSWLVHFQNFNFKVLRGGHCQYTIELIETKRPEPFIFVREPDTLGPDIMDFYIAQLKAQAKAFRLHNALAQIYNSIGKIDEYLANVRSILRDIRTLAELPMNLLNRLKFELSMILLHCEIIMAETKRLLTVPARTYSAFESMLSYVYQYVQGIFQEAGFMWTRANSLPNKEKTHIVTNQDTLQSISKQYYNTYSRWTDIAYANKIIDPTTIKPGDSLIIPI